MPSKSTKKVKVNKKGVDKAFLIVAAVATFGLLGILTLLNTNAAKPTTSGNGAPSGAHFNLNVIGVPKEKTADITTGNRMFVPLEGNCRVDLSEGDFGVTDANCTDGRGGFQLPNPDTDGDGVTTYSVYAKPLGKPNGKAKVTTCGTDPTTLEEICSIESTAFVREKGKSSFTNVTKGFLTVLADLDGDETTAPERVSIFDPALQDYFWSYDNNGLRVLQLRFYEVATNVN